MRYSGARVLGLYVQRKQAVPERQLRLIEQLTQSDEQ